MERLLRLNQPSHHRDTAPLGAWAVALLPSHAFMPLGLPFWTRRRCQSRSDNDGHARSPRAAPQCEIKMSRPDILELAARRPKSRHVAFLARPIPLRGCMPHTEHAGGPGHARFLNGGDSTFHRLVRAWRRVMTGDSWQLACTRGLHSLTLALHSTFLRQ